MAEEEAERNATSIRVSAAAERDAAKDRAEAMRELARAEADRITIKAEAMKVEKLADSDGTRALNDAENSLSDKIIDFRLARDRLNALPAIVAEMVKPAEKIGAITIHKVDGLGGASGGNAGSGGIGSGGGLVNQAFDEIRRNAFELPALSAIGSAVGISMDTGLSGILSKEFSAEKMGKAIEDALPRLSDDTADPNATENASD